MSHFEFYTTDSEGNPTSQVQEIEYKDWRLMLLYWKWDVRQFRHFIDLAGAAPGHPIDVTKFDEKGELLLFSARLVFHK